VIILYTQGLSLATVSQRFGRSAGAIQNYSIRLGVQRHSTFGKNDLVDDVNVFDEIALLGPPTEYPRDGQGWDATEEGIRPGLPVGGRVK
jgi:hypothetical protein